MTPARRARQQRWHRKLADVVTCPECGTTWTRTNRQRSDGTVCCSSSCTVAAGNRARRAQTTEAARWRYATTVLRCAALGRLVSRQVDAVVALMLDARREGLHAGATRAAHRKVA